MLNKQTLSLKLNKPFLGASDAPFTPVEQTLHTPKDVQGQLSYFPPHLQPIHPYSNPQYSESDDILTDGDDLQMHVNRNYSISFTLNFDQLLMNIYSYFLLLPTTTPFLGITPPLGLVSRVANETLLTVSRNVLEEASNPNFEYDTQNILSFENVSNRSYKPIFLQLIRKRLLDLCSTQKVGGSSKSASDQAPTVTSVQISVPSLIPSNSGNHCQSQNSVYQGLGLKQLSISNLLLSEQNISNYQQNQQGQVPHNAQAALNSSRLRSSSLNLRKQSLTRNNSYSGSNWLHVGNMSSARSANTPMNGGQLLDNNASTDSLQLMHDFVPHAFLNRQGSTLSNGSQNVGSGFNSGFNSMMLDYQTPVSSGKSINSVGSTSPSRDCISSSGSISETESVGSLFFRSRYSSRGNSSNCPVLKPLVINTDPNNFSHSTLQTPVFGGNLNGEGLHSPFVSAITPSEDFGYFLSGCTSAPSSNNTGVTTPNSGSFRSGNLIPESPVKDATSSKLNMTSQFGLSEKKRDSLKLKRGIL